MLIMSLKESYVLASPSPVPLEELYVAGLSLLQEMGFFDTQENIRALNPRLEMSMLLLGGYWRTLASRLLLVDVQPRHSHCGPDINWLCITSFFLYIWWPKNLHVQHHDMQTYCSVAMYFIGSTVVEFGIEIVKEIVWFVISSNWLWFVYISPNWLWFVMSAPWFSFANNNLCIKSGWVTPLMWMISLPALVTWVDAKFLENQVPIRIQITGIRTAPVLGLHASSIP